MRFGPRKSTPKVRGGKPLRKNRSAPTPSYWNTDQLRPVIDRQRPGNGYRHVLLSRDVERFTRLLPDWAELSCDLHAIVLAPGSTSSFGWHRAGVVAVRAWDRELHQHWDNDFADEHREVLTRLGVEQARDDHTTIVRFTETQVRGFQLLHILLHELGHHHDRMTTRSKARSSRGEAYAEDYANRYAATIYERYFEQFGW
jgi:hypothetical protein